MEPSVQERHGAFRACPEEGHKNDPRMKTSPTGQAERAGAVQHGEGRAAGRAESGLSVSKGEL